MQKSLFQDIVEGAGYECESYSGRGMFGNYCLGVRLADDQTPGQFVSAIFDSLANRAYKVGNDFLDDIEACSNAFLKMREDNMGKGTILYFTTLKYGDQDLEDENLDEEDN